MAYEMRVELIGLERNVDLNGKIALVVDYDTKNDRFIVILDGEKVKVKPKNIRTLDEEFNTQMRRFQNRFSQDRHKAPRSLRVKSEKEECSICMEEMEGEVRLKCGHRMCPSCFARHSRVNNRCPYCRDEFAPERQKKLEISDTLANTMVLETVRDYYHDEKIDEEINEALDIILDNDSPLHRAQLKANVYANMDGVCRDMLETIEEWYSENM